MPFFSFLIRTVTARKRLPREKEREAGRLEGRDEKSSCFNKNSKTETLGLDRDQAGNEVQ